MLIMNYNSKCRDYHTNNQLNNEHGPGRISNNNRGLLRHELDSLCIVILIATSPLFEASWYTTNCNIIIEPRYVLGSFGCRVGNVLQS